ncbi:MAG: precorrin-8X methylmutase [Nitrospiraceae bacterium]|nr:MAG: precorrin-8X methylmutase [Nitrospiraceae bacterium]
MEKIIIAGHGSPRKEANNIEQVAGLLHTMLHPECSDDCVRVAYLQFAKPDIREALEACVQDGAQKVIVHPYFLSSGMHVTSDIPELILEAQGRFPDVEFIYTEPLGIHNKMAEVVLERIRAASGLTPGEIEKRSFEIICEEIDLRDVPGERVPIIKRVIHATADFEFKSSLVFHPDAVKAGMEAIKAGKDILTDVEMVRAGISKKLLEKWGGKVVCNIQGSGARGKGKEIKTRSEQGIEEALKANNNIGIIAIGNAPTALLKTIELLHGQGVLPYAPTDPFPLVIGVPVGFVKAVESKAELAKQTFPFITNSSRKGGSTVAVAIVNALLKMAEER